MKTKKQKPLLRDVLTAARAVVAKFDAPGHSLFVVLDKEMAALRKALKMRKP